MFSQLLSPVKSLTPQSVSLEDHQNSSLRANKVIGSSTWPKRMFCNSAAQCSVSGTPPPPWYISEKLNSWRGGENKFGFGGLLQLNKLRGLGFTHWDGMGCNILNNILNCFLILHISIAHCTFSLHTLYNYNCQLVIINASSTTSVIFPVWISDSETILFHPKLSCPNIIINAQPIRNAVQHFSREVVPLPAEPPLWKSGQPDRWS